MYGSARILEAIVNNYSISRSYILLETGWHKSWLNG